MKYIFFAVIIIWFCSDAVAQNECEKIVSFSFYNNENASLFEGKFVQPTKILLINAFDAMSLKERKNKKELFRDLADSVVNWITNEFQSKGKQVIIPDSINYTNNFDSTVASLLNKHEAKFAIVIIFLNAWFDLTDVKVEKDFFDKSKNKTAFFDICSTISYKLYNDQGLLKKSDSEMRRFFTSRPTMGSMLSFGPDVVGKRKHVIQILHDNTMKLLTEL